MFILVNYIILCLSSWPVLSSLYYFYVDNLGRFRFYTFRHCYIPTLRFPFVGKFGRLADSFSPWKDFRTWNSPIKPTRYFSRSRGTRIRYNRIISSMANQRNKSHHTYGRFAASLITISIYPAERHSNFHDKSSPITSQIRRTWTRKISVFSNSIFYLGGNCMLYWRISRSENERFLSEMSFGSVCSLERCFVSLSFLPISYTYQLTRLYEKR